LVCFSGNVPSAERSSIGVVSLSDNSPVSSASDLFSGSALSSVSSIAAGPIDAADQLVALLLDDEGIKALCIDGFRNLDTDRFERNLPRLLKHYSTALRRESTTEVEVSASEFVRHRSKYTASVIRSTVDSDSIQRAQTMRTSLGRQSEATQVVEQYLDQRQALDTQGEPDFAQVYEVNDDNSNSDNSGSEDQNDRDHLAPLNLQEERVKTFLINSNAFEDLREGLMGFVIPIQIASQKYGPVHQSVKQKLHESLRFAEQEAAESPGLPELDFLNLISEICGNLISQCKASYN